MSIKIFHPGNSALCFETEKSKLIIDGIYCSDDSIKNVGMSPMPAGYEAMIKTEAGAFSSPDMIAFTHTHTDHYDEKEVSEYLAANQGVCYFSMNDSRNNVPIETAEAVEVIRMKDFELFVLPVRHLTVGDIVEDVPSCSFLLKYGQENYFIGGDSHLDSEAYDKYCSVLGCNIKYAFLNAVQIASGFGQQFIRKLKPETIVIYHLPEKEDDLFNYYSFVRNFERKCPEDMPQYIVAKHMEWINV